MTIVFTPSALVVVVNGDISVTTFCPRDHAKVVASSTSLLPYACLPCEPGWRSAGGVSHSCTKCVGLQCVDSEDTTFIATLNVTDTMYELHSGDKVASSK